MHGTTEARGRWPLATGSPVAGCTVAGPGCVNHGASCKPHASGCETAGAGCKTRGSSCETDGANCKTDGTSCETSGPGCESCSVRCSLRTRSCCQPQSLRTGTGVHGSREAAIPARGSRPPQQRLTPNHARLSWWTLSRAYVNTTASPTRMSSEARDTLSRFGSASTARRMSIASTIAANGCAARNAVASIARPRSSLPIFAPCPN